ncbi:MAG: D-2-hydroxyacid dehydrogenase [Acidobacteriaceae bacterium]|nr:D-2-hydroxyacid dehydrogenase [Acidobacteriaceae bacterium]MBV8569386.1 D-2-hydroxyacid dehydrogenase [Acidobacteriaceae bacterium]
MPKPKLLVVCPPDHYVLRNLNSLRDSAEIFVGNDTAALSRHAGQAEIILYSGLTGKTVDFPEVWKHARAVRWVHSLSAGVEKLLFPELIESPVPVTNAKGVFKRSLAEFAVLGMLYFHKHVRRMVDSQRAHKWDDFRVGWLPGKVMGVVGYGEIGRECALLAKALGVAIYAARRNPTLSQQDPILDRIYSPDQLSDFLHELDVLLMAAPLTPETHHMISDAAFESMKAAAIVINVGRGPVIDEAALIRALEKRKIAGAALDVFEVEPLPQSSPLWDMENVLISPHCTDRTDDPDWLDLAMQPFLKNFQHFAKGEPLINVVDKKAGY